VLPSPLSAEREPNQSFAPLFEALMNACWDHVVPLRTKMYAAPAERSAARSSSHP
jgi:hypothetical protein